MKHSTTHKQTSPGIRLPNYTAALTIPSFPDDNDIPEPTLPSLTRHSCLKQNAREHRFHPYPATRKGDLLTTVLHETHNLSLSLKDLHRKIDILIGEYQKITGSTFDHEEPEKCCSKFAHRNESDSEESDNGSNRGYNSSATENNNDSKETMLKETSIRFLIN